MVSVSLTDAPRLRLRRRKAWYRYGRPPLGSAFLVTLVFVAGSVLVTQHRSHTSKHQDSWAFVPQDLHPTSLSTGQEQLDWCLSLQCQKRLEDLKSKLTLEEDIFQQQFQYERRRTLHDGLYRHYKQSEIVRQFEKEIQSDLKRNKYNNPDEDYDFEPDEKWITDGSFPEINVIGNLKTGTSQLYNIFATHEDVVNIPDDWKEHCLHSHYGEKGTPQDTFQHGLHAWHEFYYNAKVHGKKQVNGCLELDDVQRRLVYNPPKDADTKFFVLLRDPVDWAWSAYNFWTNDGWDTNYDEEDNWVKDAKTHYRSPEAFHEAILSGEKMRGMEDIQELKVISVKRLRRMAALVGKENLVVLKNEDLKPSRIRESGLLQKLAEATGLAMDGFDKNILQSRSNCNTNKGMKALCSDHEYEHSSDITIVNKTGIDRSSQTMKEIIPKFQSKNSWVPDEMAEATSGATTWTKSTTQNGQSHTVGYPVTHYRPMLEATRRFIYLQWHKECKIWAEEFGVEYPECLFAIP